MRIKRISVSTECIFEILKMLDLDEVIPEDATIEGIETRSVIDQDNMIGLLINDNSFENSKEILDLPVRLADDKINILKNTILSMAKSVKNEIEKDDILQEDINEQDKN
jgi:hypothetical protein